MINVSIQIILGAIEREQEVNFSWFCGGDGEGVGVVSGKRG